MATILIIDDDEAMLGFLTEVLTAVQHTVLTAPTGKQGLEVARQTAVDVIITDILMPDRDGLEVIRELRKLDPRALIIAISGGGTYLGLDPLQTASDFGAIACLSKPFSIQQLRDLISRVNDGARNGEQVPGAAEPP